MEIVLFSKQDISGENSGRKNSNVQLYNFPYPVFCELIQCFEIQFLLENPRVMNCLQLNEWAPILPANNLCKTFDSFHDLICCKGIHLLIFLFVPWNASKVKNVICTGNNRRKCGRSFFPWKKKWVLHGTFAVHFVYLPGTGVMKMAYLRNVSLNKDPGFWCLKGQELSLSLNR